MTDELPVRHNIDSYPDTRIRRVFLWLADGEPKDLTDWTGRLRIGQHGQLLEEVAGAVALGGSEGTASLHIVPNTLAVGTYWYNVDLIDPTSEPVRLVNGRIRVSAVYQ